MLKKEVLLDKDISEVVVAFGELVDDGVIVLSSQGEIVYMNEPARSIFPNLQQSTCVEDLLQLIRQNDQVSSLNVSISKLSQQSFSDLPFTLAHFPKRRFALSSRPLDIASDNTSILLKIKEIVYDSNQGMHESDFPNQLICAIPNAFFYKSMDGIIRKYNEAFREYFGLESLNLKGLRSEDLFDRELLEQVYDKDERLFAKEADMVALAAFDKRRNRHIKIYKSAYRSEKKEIVGLIGLIVDVTEQEEVKEKLRLYNQQLSLAIEGAGAGFFTYEIATDLNYWDAKTSQMFGKGLQPMTLSMEQFIKYVHPEDSQLFTDMVERDFHGFTTLDIDYRIRVHNKVKYINAQGTIERDSNGVAVRVIGIHLDVTKEVESKKQLLASEEKYRNIFESIQEGYIYLDHLGNCKNANPAAKRILNEASVEDIIGVNFFRKYFYNSSDLRKIRSQLESRETSNIKLMLKRTDGTYLIADFNLRRHRTGTTVHIEGTFRDITKEVEIHDYVISASIEAEDQQRKIIAQNLHDGLQQMLITTKMTFESMRGKVPPEFEKRYLDGLRLLDSSIEETRGVSHQLMPMQVSDVGLEPVLTSLVEYLDSAHTQMSFVFYTNLNDRRFSSQIEMGLYRIVQEATNNILKYSQASEVEISLYFVKNILQMIIEDNGVGFDVESATETIKRDGFGIMSMQNRTTSMGGIFEINSQPGKGTSILVKIPMTRELPKAD